MLTYRWTTPQGTLASPAERQTLWTAPQQEGTVPVTVTVNDGKGGTASETVNIQVIRPPVKTYTFEDVHFDFDRYTLRPEATRVLDEAVAAMKQDATLRLQLEGHTCNIGTAEYNLALGDRRANAVRDYLINRGVAAGRLSTVSYGEERPKYDNAREETRRLNRRAALVVNLTEVRDMRFVHLYLVGYCRARRRRGPRAVAVRGSREGQRRLDRHRSGDRGGAGHHARGQLGQA